LPGKHKAALAFGPIVGTTFLKARTTRVVREEIEQADRIKTHFTNVGVTTLCMYCETLIPDGRTKCTICHTPHGDVGPMHGNTLPLRAWSSTDPIEPVGDLHCPENINATGPRNRNPLTMKNNRDKARNWMNRAEKGVQSRVLNSEGVWVNYGPARTYLRDDDGKGWIAEMCRNEPEWLANTPDLANASQEDWDLVDDLARSEGQPELQLSKAERLARGYDKTKTIKYKTPGGRDYSANRSYGPIRTNPYLPQMRKNVAIAADRVDDWWNESAGSRSNAQPSRSSQSWSSNSWK
jgi:hypothetical protein